MMTKGGGFETRPYGQLRAYSNRSVPYGVICVKSTRLAVIISSDSAVHDFW